MYPKMIRFLGKYISTEPKGGVQMKQCCQVKLIFHKAVMRSCTTTIGQTKARENEK